jgi:hypothetical protein
LSSKSPGGSLFKMSLRPGPLVVKLVHRGEVGLGVKLVPRGEVGYFVHSQIHSLTCRGERKME